jgi:histone H3/H4
MLNFAPPRRRRRVLRDNIRGLARPQFLRIAHSAGVERLSALCYEELRSIVQVFLHDHMKKITQKVLDEGRRIVTESDVDATTMGKGTLHFAQLPFERLVREVTQFYTDQSDRDLWFHRESLTKLQHLCEHMLVDRLRKANAKAVHANRVTVFPTDL